MAILAGLKVGYLPFPRCSSRVVVAVAAAGQREEEEVVVKCNWRRPRSA